MRIVDFNSKATISDKMLLMDYAKKLKADSIVIHKDSSVSLGFPNGMVCECYMPCSKEMYLQ